MKLAFDIVLVLHLLAFATVLGGVLAEAKNFKTGAKVNSGIIHGSWLALITGLTMAGLLPFAEPEESLNGTTLAIKGLALTGVFFIAYTFQKKETTPKWVVPTIGALEIVALSVAVIGGVTL